MTPNASGDGQHATSRVHTVNTSPHLRVSAVRQLAPHLVRTMPWSVLLAGCLSGTALLVILDNTSRFPLSPNAVRLALLPAVAALCFVPHVHFRPVTQTVPLPTWVAAAGHTLLALPILAATWAIQLRLMTGSFPAHSPVAPPADYPLIAQLVGWTALAVLAATWCDRTRYANLNGAVAAPITIAAIAVAWLAPRLSRLLNAPQAEPHPATVAWYAIAACASIGSWLTTRDQWHRYTRRLAARRII
jgi:hypothetical protein